MKNLNATDKLDYEFKKEELMREGARTLTLIAIFLFPSFSFLDRFSYAHLFHVLSLIRFSTTALLVSLYFIYLRRKSFPLPLLGITVLLSLASFSITLMCIQLGGAQSHYYAGINLVVLGVVLVLPLSGIMTSWLISLIIGIYFSGMWFTHGNELFVNHVFINNCYFILSTALIGIISAYRSEKLRQISYRRKIENERNKNLLQAELKSEQSNIELLIKELTKKRAELEKALTLREEFISVASHELNTPLTSLKLQTQLVKKRMDLEQTNMLNLEKLINTYERQIERLILIVNDMLESTKSNGSKFELSCEPVDAVPLIKDILGRICDKNAEFCNIQFEEPKQLVGHWDSYRIEQALLNLISNAVKYGNNKPIKVLLEEKNNKAVITVHDQGIGIPEEKIDSIFNRFERAVKGQEFPGLGLGLYITKQIIEAHQGTVSVESKMNMGSVFSVQLPIQV